MRLTFGDESQSQFIELVYALRTFYIIYINTIYQNTIGTSINKMRALSVSAINFTESVSHTPRASL